MRILLPRLAQRLRTHVYTRAHRQVQADSTLDYQAREHASKKTCMQTSSCTHALACALTLPHSHTQRGARHTSCTRCSAYHALPLSLDINVLSQGSKTGGATCAPGDKNSIDHPISKPCVPARGVGVEGSSAHPVPQCTPSAPVHTQCPSAHPAPQCTPSAPVHTQCPSAHPVPPGPFVKRLCRGGPCEHRLR